jgi:hypothetical protein
MAMEARGIRKALACLRPCGAPRACSLTASAAAELPRARKLATIALAEHGEQPIMPIDQLSYTVIARKPRPRKEPPRERIKHLAIVRPVVETIDHDEQERRGAAADKLWHELVRRASEHETHR